MKQTDRISSPISPNIEPSLAPGRYRIVFPQLVSKRVPDWFEPVEDSGELYESTEGEPYDVDNDRCSTLLGDVASYAKYHEDHGLTPAPDTHANARRDLRSTDLGPKLGKLLDSFMLDAAFILPHLPEVRLEYGGLESSIPYRFELHTCTPLANIDIFTELCARYHEDFTTALGGRYCSIAINSGPPLSSERAAVQTENFWAGPNHQRLENPQHRVVAEFLTQAAVDRFGHPVLVQVEGIPAIGQNVFKLWPTPEMDADEDDLRAWVKSTLGREAADRFDAFELGESRLEVAPRPLKRLNLIDRETRETAQLGANDDDGSPTTSDPLTLESAPSLNAFMGRPSLPPDSVPEATPDWLLKAAREVQQRLLDQADRPFRPDLNVRHDPTTGEFTVNIGTVPARDSRAEAEAVTFAVHTELIEAGRDSDALWRFTVNNFGRDVHGEFPFPRLSTGHRNYVISPGLPVHDESEALLAAMLVVETEKRFGAAPSTVRISLGDNPAHIVLTAAPPLYGVDHQEFAAALPAIAATIRARFSDPIDGPRFVVRAGVPDPSLATRPSPESSSKNQLHTRMAVSAVHGEKTLATTPGNAENPERGENPLSIIRETLLAASEDPRLDAYPQLKTFLRDAAQLKADPEREKPAPATEPPPLTPKATPPPAPDPTPQPELVGPVRGVSR